MSTYDVTCVNEECDYFGGICEVVHKMSEPHPPCLLCGEKLETYFSKEMVKPVQFKGDAWSVKGNAY